MFGSQYLTIVKELNKYFHLLLPLENMFYGENKVINICVQII